MNYITCTHDPASRYITPCHVTAQYITHTNIQKTLYTYLHTSIHTCIHIRKHTNMNTYMHAHIHACIQFIVARVINNPPPSPQL